MILKKYKFYYYVGLNFILTIIAGPAQLTAEPPDIDQWFHKAVILKTYKQSYDWHIPWEKGEITTQTGMAMVVHLPEPPNSPASENASRKNLYLLTTTEMVADATLIEATLKDIRTPFQAELMLMDYAANLALLHIEKEKFWDDLKPVQFYPVKETSNSDTKSVKSLTIKSLDEWEFESGTIERMAVGYREKSDAFFPVLKLSGLSKSEHGYPVLQDNKTVGMIIDSGGVEGVKAIPAGMLLEFLLHAGSDLYQSLSHRGFRWKRLPQRSMADYYGIPLDKSGIWISQVLPYGTGSDVLQHGDYLTKIGRWELSHDGKIMHPKWGLSLFDLLFLDQLKVGDSVELSVIRDRKLIASQTKIATYENDRRLIPLKSVGHSPRYIIQGGLLFQELTMNYLSMWGKNWKSRAPLRLRMYLEQNNSVLIQSEEKSTELTSVKSNMSKKQPHVVLVTQVIPDELNIGYQKLSNAIVMKVNGRSIQSLDDVSEAFANPKSEFHKIDFIPGSERMSVVMPVNKLEESNQRIKANYRIPELYSL
jgi:S1-C subfamily serine protease